MRVHWLQHVPFEGPARIGDWAESRGHRLSATHLYRGDALPDMADFDLLVVMGGPMGIHDDAEYPWLAPEKRFIGEAIGAGRRVLGVCLGAQLIADVMGAHVYRNPDKEIGWFPVERVAEPESSRLAAALPASLEVFHWHGDTFDIPAGCLHLARSAACPHQAFGFEDRVLALQFHLETTPDSAAALTEHCRDELVEAPYIQTAEAMLSEPARFERINQALDALLDALSDGCP